ncbi:hypothetical protein GYMLUDRAFT_36371 [Collybiopsis luxurians FD-317 M1]|nr:hypothetical protein GYMLUDRAFT_36371 [Collybiopsis luxurians FD-317 M1]
MCHCNCHLNGNPNCPSIDLVRAKANRPHIVGPQNQHKINPSAPGRHLSGNPYSKDCKNSYHSIPLHSDTLKTFSATMIEGVDNERYLLSLEKLGLLEIIVRDIEAKSKSPNIPPVYGKSVKNLSNEVKIVLNIVLYEHCAAPEQLKREMLNQLEDRLQELSRSAMCH